MQAFVRLPGYMHGTCYETAKIEGFEILLDGCERVLLVAKTLRTTAGYLSLQTVHERSWHDQVINFSVFYPGSLVA